MNNKIAGYLLITAAVALILFALMGLYKVFIGGGAVLTLVNLPDLALKTQYGPLTIPLNGINPVLNISLFAVFMMCVMTAGGALGTLGTNLIKAERIHDALLQLNVEQATSKEATRKL